MTEIWMVYLRPIALLIGLFFLPSVAMHWLAHWRGWWRDDEWYWAPPALVLVFIVLALIWLIGGLLGCGIFGWETPNICAEAS